MTGIRTRILISVAVLLAAVALLVLPASIWWLNSGFNQYELHDANRQMSLLEAQLGERMEVTRRNAFDYGHWALAAEYMRNGNQEFLIESFGNENLRTLDHDLVFLATPQLKINTALARTDYRPDSRSNHANGLSALEHSLVVQLLANQRVQVLARNIGSLGLLVQADGRWYVLGVGSISHPTDPENEILGLLGFASELTDARMQALLPAADTRFEIIASPAQGPDPRANLVGDGVQAEGYARDTGGAISAGLRLLKPRELVAQQQMARIALVLVVLGVLLLGSILTLVFVDRHLLRRLVDLQAGLKKMREGTLTEVPADKRHDEISRLGLGINALHRELTRSTERWQHEAQHDPLTGLGNRTLLMRKLEGQPDKAEHGLRALLLLNLNGFKPINDMFGHASGDRVLVRVADCLRNNLPAKASAFRLSGDEFALLMYPQRPEQAMALAEQLRRAIPPASVGEALVIPLRVSIGVACMRDEYGQSVTASELLQRADIALHEAKNGQHGDVVQFDESLMASVQQLRDLERALRKAVSEKRLDTWYQPIISARTGRLLRIEALARWHHPKLGSVDPASFISIAEQSGLAPSLDLMMLQNALAAVKQVHTLRPQAGVAVNVSAQSLCDEDYISAATKAVARAGLAPGTVMLELTETALSSNEASLEGPLKTLREAGMRIQLDDFGVGYSSLARLAQLDPVGIKLDGSFVRNRRNGGEKTCLAIIGMARQLGMTITAEYVESDDDALFLRNAGCDALQGFSISRPLPLPELLAWLGEPERNSWTQPVPTKPD